MDKENRSILRNLSRRKSVKLPGETTPARLSHNKSVRLAKLPSGDSNSFRSVSRKFSSKRGDSTPGRSLSRKRSLCEKLSRKDEPVFGSRAKTDATTVAAKQAVVDANGQLVIVEPADKIEELVLTGSNSLRAEIVDLNAMVRIMQDHVTMLSHDIVERVFDWVPLFNVFVERLLLIEEEWIVRWAEAKGGMKGKLRSSVRMALRGRVQRAVEEVDEVREEFKPHLPAGERLPRLVERVADLTELAVQYVEMIASLVDIVRERFTLVEVEKQRLKMMKHVVGHVGYEDFLVVYTRWMGGGALLEWKGKTLFPCDFKFFSYGGWEKDMEVAHYGIAGGFGGWVEREEKEQEEMNKERKREFERALQNRIDMGVGEEEVAEEDYEEDEERDQEQEK